MTTNICAGGPDLGNIIREYYSTIEDANMALWDLLLAIITRVKRLWFSIKEREKMLFFHEKASGKKDYHLSFSMKCFLLKIVEFNYTLASGTRRSWEVFSIIVTEHCGYFPWQWFSFCLLLIISQTGAQYLNAWNI